MLGKMAGWKLKYFICAHGRGQSSLP
jgi:hypothetical protein